MNLFWIDVFRDREVDYQTFLTALTMAGTNSSYILDEDPYKVYEMLLRNFLNGKKSVILDSDFSSEELRTLGLRDSYLTQGKYFQMDLKQEYPTFNAIIKYLQDQSQNLEIEIYTSGTTGKPKSISQSLKNLTRAVQI
ncbi:MAG: hypothetical protein KJO52_06120, partial [Maribacter sp.]|nr:hypothetical protein [Maribacter sp.]